MGHFGWMGKKIGPNICQGKSGVVSFLVGGGGVGGYVEGAGGRGKGCPKVAQNVLKHALVLELLSFNEFFFWGGGGSKSNSQPTQQPTKMTPE